MSSEKNLFPVEVSVPKTEQKPSEAHQHLKKILGLDDFQHPFLDRMNIIEDKLDKLVRNLEKKGIASPSIAILDNADFIQLFKITGKTAQNWRDEGLTEFSQVKGKIYYSLQDIEKLLKKGRG